MRDRIIEIDLCNSCVSSQRGNTKKENSNLKLIKHIGLQILNCMVIQEKKLSLAVPSLFSAAVQGLTAERCNIY